jgi:hypothetical protein
MKRYYCTYFDRNYLVKALALFNSLARHEDRDYVVIAVCLDEITRIILENIKPPNVELIPLHLIEKNDSELLAAKGNRTLIEYYWTLTPSVVLYLLEQYPGIDRITYLDADLFFYSTPSPIFEEMGDNSVLVHEHRFSQSMTHLESLCGRFNVGLIVFQNDDIARATLKWWRESCIEWCYHQFGNGKMGDQMYLDEWPERFVKVHVLQHLGAGVAPWNHEQYDINPGAEASVTINGYPLIFYHFHALDFSEPDIIIPARHTHYPLNIEVIRLCYLPYLYALKEVIKEIDLVLPGFVFGLVTKLPNIQQTFIAQRRKRGYFGNIDSSHVSVVLDDMWDCFCTGQLKQSQVNSGDLTNL